MGFEPAEAKSLRRKADPLAETSFRRIQQKARTDYGQVLVEAAVTGAFTRFWGGGWEVTRYVRARFVWSAKPLKDVLDPPSCVLDAGHGLPHCGEPIYSATL